VLSVAEAEAVAATREDGGHQQYDEGVGGRDGQCDQSGCQADQPDLPSSGSSSTSAAVAGPLTMPTARP
jgi:hypothetical protein